MAKASSPSKPKPKADKKKPKKKAAPKRSLKQRVLLGLALGFAFLIALIFVVTLLWRFVNPPTTPYMFSEGRRLGESVRQTWVPIEEIAPVMARSAVAAEDANFCLHWGLDVQAIRETIARGSRGGASTISQQTVKNVFLWHGRSWSRKAFEALWTPLTEALWPKQRILEVYLNIAEFDEGVFGVQAAGRHYFGVDAADLTAVQAARLAAILPDPKNRSALRPSNFVRKRAASILDGAETIAVDGRADCFEQ
jgi:monofunctional biosynthetic peptidoglycan transglycosylase